MISTMMLLVVAASLLIIVKCLKTCKRRSTGDNDSPTCCTQTSTNGQLCACPPLILEAGVISQKYSPRVSAILPPPPLPWHRISNSNINSSTTNSRATMATTLSLDDDSEQRLAEQEAIEEILQNIYYGSDQGAYGGINRLLAAAKLVDSSITKKQVQDFLQQQDVYMQFFQDKPTISPGRSHQMSAPGQLVSLDTMYTTSLGAQFKYCLVGVDCFSRYGMCRPMAMIKATSAKKALQSMIEEAPFKFRAIYTDRGWWCRSSCQLAGSEFRNATISEYLKQERIRHVFAHPHSKSHTAFAERFIRTIRQHAGAIAKHERKGGWAAIKRAVEIYNAEVSSATGEKPKVAAVSEQAQGRIIERILLRNQKAIEKSKKPRYKLGDWVRLRRNYDDEAFAKSSKPRWSNELYRVVGVKYTMPLSSYHLQSSDGISLPGTYLENWINGPMR